MCAAFAFLCKGREFNIPCKEFTIQSLTLGLVFLYHKFTNFDDHKCTDFVNDEQNFERTKINVILQCLLGEPHYFH